MTRTDPIRLPSRHRPLLCALLLLGAPGLALPAPPAPLQPTAPIEGRRAVLPVIQEIQMFAGETRVLPQRDAQRLAVGDAKVLSAAVLDDREILLIANGPGDTMLQVWTRSGRSQRVKITVRQTDTARIARDLQGFLHDVPRLRTRSIGDNVVIEGEGLSDAERDKVAELAKRFPQLIDFTSRVGLDRMFAFDVRFVEISRSGLRDLGIDWTTQGKPLLGIGVIGDLYHDNRTGSTVTRTLGTGEQRSEVEIAASRVSPFAANVALVGSFFGRLNLLAQKGDAVILASPRLSARNRGEASFLAGGEIPVPVASATGTPSVTFKEYGIRLNILEPIADAAGTIRARIRTEVSSLDRSVAAQGVPGLLSRRTETEFNLRNGETLVLSGVLQREQQSDENAIPHLGDVPVLGSLFRSRRFNNRESELVVFVTPWLLEPGEGLLDPRAQILEQRAEQALAPEPEPEPIAREPADRTWNDLYGGN
ncbi:pilus assembly protein N-terminal domain-containing protein [Thauera sp.]|uniref:type II and III secretion system protein family protein n=1 Tax=Thauera sp. TaxID=1905334 RepID=UPI002BD48BF9|nr:pilus assembly protein N-terminal domain-containing protein [Thauera sp.]HRO34572.1 pilus assembly protein N-terminal domain-containing protein [Thauera sp.]